MAPLRTHHLRPAPGAKTAKTRVGRGDSSKGKTAGRGMKGTKARKNVPANFEGGQMSLVQRLPKIRSFKSRKGVTYSVLNLERLAQLYPEGGHVTVTDLVSRGAVRKGRPVKLLGDGEIGVPVQIDVHACSATAEEKVTAAGGSVHRQG